MNVLLCDLSTAGHHLEYAGYIATALNEIGAKLTFASPASDRELMDWAQNNGAALHSLRCSRSPRWPHALSRHREAAQLFRLALNTTNSSRVDVVHFLYADRHELAIALALATTAPRAKVFATSFWPHYLPRFNRKSSRGRRTYSATVASTLGLLLRTRRLESLFVHDETVVEDLANHPAMPMREHAVTLVPDPAKFDSKTSQEDARQALALDSHSPIALFFGGFREDKGLDVLLDALPLMKTRCTAVVAGPPYDFPMSSLERCRARLSSRQIDLVVRAERIPDDLVEAYFAAATIVVLPYKQHSIGTSGILQRAVAALKPVVASHVGLIGSTVQRSGLGITVKPEDPIALAAGLDTALADRDFSHRRRMNLERYAAAHDWRITGAKVVERYLRQP